jgi:ubiquitin thioesterase protein OTUB1
MIEGQDGDDITLRQQAEAQSQAIEDQTRLQPLTGIKMPLANLELQYKESPNFLAQVKKLETNYKSFRQIRGDGNCYFRAFLYSLVEHVITNDHQRTMILEYFKVVSWKNLLSGGYNEMAIEIFYDSMVELLEGLTTMEAFHESMNQENDVSDYCTWYMRAITAAYLKSDTERFLPFCLEFHCHDVAEFCARHVEPMGQECEQLQVLALAEATGIGVRIEYLDGRSATTNIQAHRFGPVDSAIQLTLLYRPGHYDILYS